ncbi:beta-propeller domain-containing protein [Pendulispora brunnea]|uniref:Beta-propeller domain-containing protein n=1 Tax=Pendulispora brunnea TaxID=2905690 RepID=A0ABZ2KKQ6_9BACT
MRKTHSLFWTACFAAAGSLTIGGCGSSSGGQAEEETGEINASLHRAQGCGDLLDDLKRDTRLKMEKSIDQQIASLQRCLLTDCNGSGGVGMDSGSNGAPTDAGGAGGGRGGESAKSYSQTNTQVKGVDEADFVKNDGKYIYILHGRAFKVLNAWPSKELKESSTFDIEGNPSEMFVADGKVVIYSYVNGVDVFTAAGVSPKNRMPNYYGYGFAGDGRATDVAGAPAQGGGSSTPYVPLTKMTVLALEGTTPKVAREVYFEGSYLDARRVGPHVRTVLQGYAYGPRLKYSYYDLVPPTAQGQSNYPKTIPEQIAVLQQIRADNEAIIDASTLADYLPYTFVKSAEGTKAQSVACEDFYVPTVGSTESGVSEVVSLDLNDPHAVPKETAILGRADTVYGGTDTLYLAARAWSWPSFAWRSGSVPWGEQPALPVRAISSARTHIHKFEFKTDAKFPNYQASGTVKGAIKDQFSLDDQDGYLRVATTESRTYIDGKGRYFWPRATLDANGEPTPDSQTNQWPTAMNQLAVLQQKDGLLLPAGKVENLAPNESIYSVRFVGSRGYVVTFRRVDPLFVFDLSSPQNPKVLAALKIPGFSEYMHPIDDRHILTIGRDGDQQGRARALQLQIFDVADGANPVLKHRFTFESGTYGSSEAEYDHKAFTYFADKKLLAFPYYNYGSYTGTTTSTLELFKVDVNTGITKLTSLDQSPLVAQQHGQGYCGGYYQPGVRRGIFLEDYAYSISYGGLVVRNAAKLDEPPVTLALPSPQINSGYGPACY